MNKLEDFFEKLSKDFSSISVERKLVLHPIIEYITKYSIKGQPSHLNFICTHNSRRSQLSQAWAQAAAHHYSIPAMCYSGGVEVTAFHPNAFHALEEDGFEIETHLGTNPEVHLTYGETSPLVMFSKLFDHPMNQTDRFAAIMTCSHADENCPFIPGTEARFALNYKDPKAFDETPEARNEYLKTSRKIALEMTYVFLNVRKQLNKK